MDKETKEILEFANRDNSEEDKLIESILKETRELNQEDQKPAHTGKKRRSRMAREIFGKNDGENGDKNRASDFYSQNQKHGSHRYEDGENEVISQVREIKKEDDQQTERFSGFEIFDNAAENAVGRDEEQPSHPKHFTDYVSGDDEGDMFADGNQYLKHHNKPVLQDIDTIDVDLSDFVEEQIRKEKTEKKLEELSTQESIKKKRELKKEKYSSSKKNKKNRRRTGEKSDKNQRAESKNSYRNDILKNDALKGSSEKQEAFLETERDELKTFSETYYENHGSEALGGKAEDPETPASKREAKKLFDESLEEQTVKTEYSYNSDSPETTNIDEPDKTPMTSPIPLDLDDSSEKEKSKEKSLASGKSKREKQKEKQQSQKKKKKSRRLEKQQAEKNVSSSEKKDSGKKDSQASGGDTETKSNVIAPDFSRIRPPSYESGKNTEKIYVKAGKFSYIVRDAYSCYAQPKSAGKRAKDEIVLDEDGEEKINVAFIKRHGGQALKSMFSGKRYKSKAETKQLNSEELIEDIERPEDVRNVKSEINVNIKSLFFRCVILGVLALFDLGLSIWQLMVPEIADITHSSAPLTVCIINAIIVAVTVIVSKTTILNGFAALARFRGNSDTALSVAIMATALQSLVALFSSGIFFSGKYSFYTLIIIICVIGNYLGKMLMLKRTKENLRFIGSEQPCYAAKIYDNEEIASKMLSGTAVGRPIIAYQHKTGFLSNYLKLSYAPDPGEDSSGVLAPFTLVCSFVISLLYAVFYGSFMGALTTLAVTTAVSVPIGNLVLANFPITRFCKSLRQTGAMITGYPSIKQFCDTSAVMVDSCELYPEGSVEIVRAKDFDQERIEEAIISAYAVLKEAKSPIQFVFKRLLEKEEDRLPSVESVLYEEGAGLVGWVNSERILIGTRLLLEKYGIDVLDEETEEKFSDGDPVVYFSHAGQLCAMFSLKYSASTIISEELQRAEENGLSIIVSTTDYNITEEKIAKDFGIFYRSVKVLPTGLANVCREVSDSKEERSRAYLATNGKLLSLLRAISGCIRLKSNIALSVLLQTIAVIVGVLLVSTLALYSGVSSVKTLEMSLFMVFWLAAVIVPSLIQRP